MNGINQDGGLEQMDRECMPERMRSDELVRSEPLFAFGGSSMVLVVIGRPGAASQRGSNLDTALEELRTISSSWVDKDLAKNI
jgi:hypothetical protein